jgi:adenylate kinase
VILLGAPGSGKGTLGAQIAKAYGFPRISTGDLLRAAVREGAPLGRQAAEIMSSGGLVGDEIVNALVRDRIAAPDCRAGYVLDGYPRTTAQAEAIEAMDPKRPEVVLDLVVGEARIVERLGGRRVCPACDAVYNVSSRPPRVEGVCDACGGGLVRRSDDDPAVVRERFRVYRAATEPLEARYRARGTYRAVDGEGTPDEVFPRAARVLDAALAAASEGRA